MTWIRLALAALAAIGGALAGVFHVRQTAIENKIDDLRQQVSDERGNDMRDIWQVIEADRKSAREHREIVITALAKAATKDDVAALGREIAAQFQRRKEA